MIQDYYESLEIPRSADKDQICLAFKRLSLQWHPDRSKKTRESYKKFCQVCEAFEVLSDEHLKSIYDSKGIQALKRGYYEGDRLVGCYEFLGHPEEIFNKFFGSSNFFEALIQFENEYSTFLDEQNQFKRSPPLPIEHTVEIDLEDLYFGKTISVDLVR